MCSVKNQLISRASLISRCSGYGFPFHRNTDFCPPALWTAIHFIGVELLEWVAMPDFETKSYAHFHFKKQESRIGTNSQRIALKTYLYLFLWGPRAGKDMEMLIWVNHTRGEVQHLSSGVGEGIGKQTEESKQGGPMPDPPVAVSSDWLTRLTRHKAKGKQFLNIRNFGVIDEISAGSIINLTLVHPRTRLPYSLVYSC